MLNRRQTTNLLQIFYEILLHSQVIFKSMKVADNTFRGTLECEWVNIGPQLQLISSPEFPIHIAPRPLVTSLLAWPLGSRVF